MLLATFAVAAAVAAQGGCLQVDAADGLLTCAKVTGRECPMGYYCEPLSNSCWRNGDFPDLATPVYDFATQPFPDFHRDMSTTVDLTPLPDGS
jgi:hypothetical protein